MGYIWLNTMPRLVIQLWPVGAQSWGGVLIRVRLSYCCLTTVFNAYYCFTIVFEAYHPMTHYPTTYDLMSYGLFLLPVPFLYIYRGSKASFNKQSSYSGSAHGLPIDTYTSSFFLFCLCLCQNANIMLSLQLPMKFSNIV